MSDLLVAPVPADGTTSGQPFAPGTGGSEKFRIPALVALDDGSLVAACDARWDTTLDGGGLDTIVSRSADGGRTWRYTFANYFGDNGDRWNRTSTCFIDPALATDGRTLYMIVDIFPAGCAIYGASYPPVAGENGLTADGCLRLSADGRKTYAYYLKEGKIYAAGGTPTGETVDAHFNLGATNLFFSDCKYQVYPTNYLYFTTSSDGGATWSNPRLLNLKRPREQVLLIGPGRGVVTKDGALTFACYEYTDGVQRACLIASRDGGRTWTRTPPLPADGWSSEAQPVELSDGTLRVFYRHGGARVAYADFTAEGWRTPVTDGPAMYGNCQLSVILSPVRMDGCAALHLSCPTNAGASGNPEGRTHGAVYTGLVRNDGSMDWKYTCPVTDGGFAYSCLAPTQDGVALLYEPGEKNGVTFTRIAYPDLIK